MLASALYIIEIVLFVAFVWLVPAIFEFQFSHDSFQTYVNETSLSFSPILRVWEFLIGCTLGALLVRYEAGRSMFIDKVFYTTLGRNLALGLSLMGLLCLVSIHGPAWYWLALSYVAFTPLFALTVISLAFGRTFLTRLLDLRIVVLLGEASYGLYLLHFIPLMMLQQSFSPAHPVSTPIFLLTLAALIAGSVGFYLGVELPARRWLRGMPPRQRGPRPNVSGATESRT